MIHKGAQRVTKDTKGRKDHIVPQSYTKTIFNHSIPKPCPLFYGGSQTASNHKLGYHDSCTLCNGQCPVPRSSDFITRRTRGGTCCPRVSTPKIWSLADSSTTCHDGINHLHHSNHCSNHNIDPHTVTSHLDRWNTPTLSQRNKPNSTSQRMEDWYDSQDCMAKQN
jgi:hypothetical protein